jgi:S-adenosylmethionine hydrolase
VSYFIHVIGDYGKHDPAFSEVVHRFKSLDTGINIQTTPVPAFSTVSTGFWIAQLGLHNPEFDELAIYANTAPRKHDKEAQEDNQGEKLLYAKLENGVPVIAVNSGYSLSFVKERIEELRMINTSDKGSQFRSRDFFPKATYEILEKGERVEEELDIESRIPDPPEETIGFIDGYGNIKTTISESEIETEAEKVKITIDGKTRKAYVESNTFEVSEGELSFAAGSSGGHKNPFMEIFLRGGSAAEVFGNPDVGSDIRIDPVE